MAYIGNIPAPQNITSAEILDGSIVNVDIATNAAIAATKIAGLSTVATTGAYSDLTGKPSLVASLADLGVSASSAELNHSSGVTSAIQTQLDAKAATSSLSTVATSGAYSDLTGAPAIPTDFVSAASGGTFSGTVDVGGELIADSYNETYSGLSGTSPTVNCEAGNAFSLTLSGNTTFTFSNPPASGTAYSFSIEIIQDASASGFVVTWPSSVDWPSATAPTLTATASAKDVFVFYSRDGGTTFYGFTAGQALG